MTNQEKKQYLLQYRNNESEISRTIEELTRWESRARRVTSGWSDLSSGTSNQGDRIQMCVEKIIEMQNKLAEQIDRGVALREDIEKAIGAVADDRLRLLLRYRYIDGYTWERIAVEMHYSWRQVVRMHGKALEEMS
ncbi:hypothetical protein H8711_04030 [Clostridiaceae bacterium NSJ-31]|uniref:DUF1492 domain-containing protein n=1 Tax=Ligaoa zhengdingensis TaxID=2763658 RepID=A0A926DY83_9FIRM|nr:hypothetical protein [Ligaoa zhengdingensis]MBC8546103.1 hypothetical protein [Ligaoa zhengdingensis]